MKDLLKNKRVIGIVSAILIALGSYLAGSESLTQAALSVASAAMGGN
jgi:hypothetical protein